MSCYVCKMCFVTTCYFDGRFCSKCYNINQLSDSMNEDTKEDFLEMLRKKCIAKRDEYVMSLKRSEQIVQRKKYSFYIQN